MATCHTADAAVVDRFDQLTRANRRLEYILQGHIELYQLARSPTTPASYWRNDPSAESVETWACVCVSRVGVDAAVEDVCRTF